MTQRAAGRFVIFAAPRTGSNLLCGLLNAHPDILCHHGLFNPGGVHRARDRRGAFGSVAERDNDPLTFLDRVWNSNRDARAIGFKINLGENPDAVEILLNDRSVRKLLLRRRNRLRTYVSEKIATRTGVWESYDPSPDAALPAIRVAADDLLRHVDRNATWYAGLEAKLLAAGQDWLDADYEALADPHQIARILAFLGVEGRASLAPTCHKRGPVNLGVVVTNLDELADALAGTPLSEDLAGKDLRDLRSPLLTS
ncbi:hypothetical protein [Sphingomonas sp. ERG5]|uniref:hypothetical protein n=1 Tax=Sphingomonas sp. ERG5 TaxID=1381597 RepID=UPI00054BFB5F|nr:hypothetical protein [Sphingomonas sp. ERG5]